MPENEDSQFVRLLTQNHSAIYAYIFSLHPSAADADDIMQETSAGLWKRFSEFDSQRGSFLPWAYRFAYYEVLRFRKTRSRSRIVFDDNLLDKIAETMQQQHENLNQRSTLLHACVTRLPKQDQDLLSARYGSSFSIEKFSQQLKIPAKKLYRELERIRLVLFRCVDRQLNQKRRWI